MGHRLPVELRKLGLTVVDTRARGVEARRRYIETLRGFLRSFLSRDGTEVVLIPQVTNRWQSTASLEADLLRGMDRSRVRSVTGQPTVDELIALYRGIDMLVATRMHSAIFALCQGTPAVTLPYVEGGKWGILDMLGAHDIAVPYGDATAESLERKVESVWRRKSELLASVQDALPALAAAVEENVGIPIDLYLSRTRGTVQPDVGHA
jgi:polysaccharide pyruvyl transferase WcaK-like protein